MNEQKALEIIQQIFLSIFREENPFSLEEIKERFAKEIKLPIQVEDSTTKESTWTDQLTDSYITQTNMEHLDETKGWMRKNQSLETIEDIFAIWKQINYKTTERVYDCEEVSESDTLYGCISAYRSLNCRGCKKIVFTEGCGSGEYLLACKNSGECNYCIQVYDSGTCSNSCSVICSSKISNSLFIQDCFNLHECIFCAHIVNKRYCIGNIQLEKEEYFKWKKRIIHWFLHNETDIK